MFWIALLFQLITVSGLVSIEVEVSDITDNPGDYESGVDWVEVLVDGEVLQRTTDPPPYRFMWDTRIVIDGVHILTARAADYAGNVGSATLAANVDNTTVVPVKKRPGQITSQN